METSSRARSAGITRRYCWERALGSVAAALALAVAPFAARDAAAQRPSAIGTVAMVAAPHLAIALHSDADSAGAADPSDVRQVRIAGVGVLDIRSASGAAIRIAPRDVGRPNADPGAGRPGDVPVPQPPTVRVIRITIDHVGS